MQPLVILADDLTGTLDAGVQLAKAGVGVVAFRDAYAFFASDTNAVSAVCLNTRHLSADDAYQTARDCLERLESKGVSRLYLKTDSGLRGNIAPVFLAALHVWRRDIAFAPAYPAMGRTVTNGRLLLDGAPVSQSVYARDPLEPIRQDRVRDILQSRALLPFLDPDDPQEHAPAVRLYDAATDAELEAIAARLSGRDVVLAGCAGFARYLPRGLRLASGSVRAVALPKPCLVVSGSASEVSLHQLRHAQRNGAYSYLLSKPLEENRDWVCDAERIARALRQGKNVLMETARTSEQVTALSEAAAALGLSRAQTGERIVNAMADVVRGVRERGFDGSLFVIGGDTLSAVLNRLNIRRLEPLREAAEGVVLSQTDDGGALLSKSGSFGAPSTVAALLDEINAGENR